MLNKVYQRCINLLELRNKHSDQRDRECKCSVICNYTLPLMILLSYIILLQ